MIRHWMLDQWQTYVGNATAVREYRTQLRGTKAIWLWASYLMLLIIMASGFYASVSGSTENIGISEMQSRLKGFYMMLGGLMAAIVCAGTPALTASAITLERQRKSLDLLFSAPVSPKYLLIGKMIASFRYLFMLLILALPVLSIGVVMGGATWAEVIAGLWLLIINGMILCGIGLVVSAMSTSVVAGILWSYFAVFVYLIFTSAFALPSVGMAAASSMGMGMSGGMGSREAPWIGCLSPFSATVMAGTTTNFYGTQVQNWIIATFVAFLITHWMILGASSVLSGHQSKEVRALRVGSLVYTFLIGMLSGQMAGQMLSLTAMMGGTSPGSTAQVDLGQYIGVSLMSVAVLISCFGPYIFSYSRDAERKYQPGPLFNLRAIFLGGTSGSLLFALSLLVMNFAGIVAAIIISGVLNNPSINLWTTNLGSLMVWSIGYIAFTWGVARWISSFAKDLKSARGSLLAAMLAFVGLPIPVLTLLFARYASDGEPGYLAAWVGYPSWHPEAGVFWGLGMIVASFVLVFVSERNRLAYTPLRQAPPKEILPPPTQFEV